MTVLTISEIEREETYEVYDDGDFFRKTIVSLEILDEEGDLMPPVCIDRTTIRQYGKRVLDHLLEIMYDHPGYASMCAYPVTYRDFDLQIKPTQRTLIKHLIANIYEEL